ncbi:hypothetical protein GUITHDRAFT_70974 [Guillardia theta CCMP2712]|uniref:Uncharacterized protein n=1 Tax=Guillardia theta (strain CCMP2712) TaxID=905079 RepID=L1JDF4_GUITC|nr:hypothetical protein GUITHDRAFT_70974 [Guillardia theta CCMP2712]EKX46149.1 hypothetical protein GUITHDRAFT_70974 [Guillardia theta CCMP2712]|eukprot:XP_005833129.1 hypothetical protein GUITHDRAFT_70974 [Guillardia theta CCMP2712]
MQASLLPYLAFLYFLNNNGAKTPKLSGFGFGFLLLFVIATIPTGIISKTVYGVSLADVDWLHGSAEALLTVNEGGGRREGRRERERERGGGGGRYREGE